MEARIYEYTSTGFSVIGILLDFYIIIFYLVTKRVYVGNPLYGTNNVKDIIFDSSTVSNLTNWGFVAYASISIPIAITNIVFSVLPQSDMKKYKTDVYKYSQW